MAEEKVEELVEVKPKRTRAKKAETAEVVEEAKTVEKKTTTKRTKKADASDAKDTSAKKADAPAKKATKKVSKSTVQEFLGTGKRKTSVARVRLVTGSGKIIVNGKDIAEYFKLDSLIATAKQPLVLTDLASVVDVTANIYGGGISGQAGALRHGITKALIEFRPELRTELKKAGFVTRDARKKERKKYGLKKARKAPQFSKR